MKNLNQFMAKSKAAQLAALIKLYGRTWTDEDIPALLAGGFTQADLDEAKTLAAQPEQEIK